MQRLNEEVQTLKKVEVDAICIAMKPNVMEYLQNKWLRGRRLMMMRIGCELDGTGNGIESCCQVKEDESPESSVIRKVLLILSRALSVL